MIDVNKFEGRLFKKTTKLGLTRKQFSKLSKISINTLVNVNDGERVTRQSTLAKIEKAFLKLKKRAAK